MTHSAAAPVTRRLVERSRARLGSALAAAARRLEGSAERPSQSPPPSVVAPPHVLSPANSGVAGDFLRAYYDAGDAVQLGSTWKDTWWMGARLQKLPTDLWIYQEILHAQRPDVIIECGTAFGGSALYLAQLCDLLDVGQVITVDIDGWDFEVPGYQGRPVHPRIRYVKGSSADPAIVADVAASIPEGAKVMVILDSDHSRDHVAAELKAYSPLVTPGQFLIVEDTMLNGHPVHDDFGPGPMEALQEFLPANTDFDIDPIGDKYLVSFNPKGYLRRRAASGS